MTSASHPTLTIIAGSNGAGKSTFTAAMRVTHGVPVLDPDAIARTMQQASPDQIAIQAGREVLRRQHHYLAERQSFAVETTLAGMAMLRHMEEARRNGFAVHLIYIGVEDVQIAVDRIAIRVAKGGHHVPEEDVRRRYLRSMRHLPSAIGRADLVTIVDNTTEQGPRVVLAIDHGQITMRAEELPLWVVTYVGSLL